MKRLGLILLLVVGGCATAPATRPDAATAVRTTLPPQGLERVLGKDARALEALFGRPDLDIREDRARKLQFAGAACVLDAYLYAKGSGEAVVTWLDARTPQGADFDRASCVAALSRRER